MGINYHPLQEKQLAYFHSLREKLDARKAKHASAAQRRQFLIRQKATNYQNEYDRLRGIQSQFNIPRTNTAIDERVKALQALGAKAVDSIQD